MACGVATLAVALGGAANAAAGTPSAERADRALDRALARIVAMPGGPPGVVAVVQRGARRKVFRHGVADASTDRRIAIGDHWRIASVSKAFSGAVALRLAARGRLSLSDTIGERLPQLPAAWSEVTLGQALHHTSGLPEFITDPDFVREFTSNLRRPVMPSTLISFVADQPLDFPPGTRYHYSDTDNVVVAMFVEAATGVSYVRALDAQVLDPLRLRRTTLPLGYRMPAPFVHGYDNEPGASREDVSELINMSWPWASGGMVSSPLDLTRFIRAYAGGRMFGGAVRAAQLRFRPGASGPPGPGANAAGLGIFRYRTRCGTVYGHTGNIPGYTTFIAASRDGRRSATVQASTQLSPESGAPGAFPALRRAWERAVCAALAGERGALTGRSQR